MAEQGTIKAGDTVTHPWWPEGTTAQVLAVSTQVVRARYGKNRRVLKPQREDCEIVVHLDREIGGAFEDEGRLHPVDPDAYWMESGLVVVQHVSPTPQEGSL